MREKFIKRYRELSLASRIRMSYLFILIPFIFLLIVCFGNIWEINSRYDEMIESVVTASTFSQDFKKDFDEQVYLVIAGNTSLDESGLEDMRIEAVGVTDSLKKLTNSEDNVKRLNSIEKCLANLDSYLKRLETNIQIGDMYDENINLWNDDIKIATELIQENVSEYIYYEIKEFQAAKAEYTIFYQHVIMLIIVAMIALGGLVIIFSYVIPKGISNPIKKISKVTRQVSNGDLTVRSDVDYGGEIGVLSDSLNYMIDKINDLLEQVTQEQVRLRKAELELLQSQINPHFLYNTLDTIVWLAEGSDQKKVVSMVKSLSDFFRTSLNQGRDIISVKNEIVHVRSYLEIQQVRYQDILEYEIEIPEELWGLYIPKITLQPLVENALYHGIKNKRTGGKITLSGYLKDDTGILIVEDTGLGMKPDRLEQVNKKLSDKQSKDDEIYGLSNVNERIQLKFGDGYGIKISSVYDQGTRVEISLPVSDEKNKPDE